MTLAIDDLEQLKRKVEEIKRDHDRAEGELKLLMKQMRKEFGVNSLKEAKALLAKMEAEVKKISDQYTTAKIKFKKKWKDLL